MEVVSQVAARFRSQKTSLGLGPGERRRGFVRHLDGDTSIKLKALESRISRMGTVGEVTVIAADAKDPAGTLADVVDDKCLIFTEVSGLDLSKELVKLQKKVQDADKSVVSYETKMAAPGYEQKVPADVRDMNAEKMEASKKQAQDLRKALVAIEAAMKK